MARARPRAGAGSAATRPRPTLGRNRPGWPDGVSLKERCGVCARRPRRAFGRQGRPPDRRLWEAPTGRWTVWPVSTGSENSQRSTIKAGLKRTFQVMPGAEWLELLCRHIPDRYEHLVRYVGWYSNRARGERARALKVKELATKPSTEAEPVSAFGARVKASWARLIRCTRQIRSNGRLWPKADARKASEGRGRVL